MVVNQTLISGIFSNSLRLSLLSHCLNKMVLALMSLKNELQPIGNPSIHYVLKCIVDGQITTYCVVYRICNNII